MPYVADPAHVRIFDTTLRDGEQSPGASMTLEEKIKVAQELEAMGVDIIEAGFPIASNGDFEAVREIGKLVKESVVAGLARAAQGDIDRAGEALTSRIDRRAICHDLARFDHRCFTIARCGALAER